ncbi:MAG: branched-chain amino acid aminotransferase [Clostridia bacterium]|nr:branched-chain amino acid aminotransferase [Clostridia bacterium]
MTELAIKQGENLKEKPSVDRLSFGIHFTDHMLVMDYQAGGWQGGRIEPYSNLSLDPAATVLHYGQAIFEGLKAYHMKDGRIGIFRPRDAFARLNRSANRLCMPAIDEEDVLVGLKALIGVDKEWVPTAKETSLYIRPFMIASEAFLGVRPASTYKFVIILSPVGAYYPEGFKPVRIMVENQYVRAVRGGLGFAKASANYAASLLAQEEAKKAGYAQVLWLDGIEQKYVEEVGTMNIFFVIGDELITPSLNGSILGGITRNSVLTIAKDWGLKVAERQTSIEEIYQASQKGLLKEIFGTGTAAVISPVNELNWDGKIIVPGNGGVGELSQKLYQHITGIQYGKVIDTYNWMEVL